MPRQPPCCCGGGRSYICSGGEISAAPASFNITFSGWSGSDGCTDSCDWINGTWVLPHCSATSLCNNCGGPSVSNTCCWMDRFTGAKCGITYCLDLSLCLIEAIGVKRWNLILYAHACSAPCTNAHGSGWLSDIVSGPPWSASPIVLTSADPTYLGQPCAGPFPTIS